MNKYRLVVSVNGEETKRLIEACSIEEAMEQAETIMEYYDFYGNAEIKSIEEFDGITENL